MEFKKTWTKCTNHLTDVYTPSLQPPPTKDKWILCGTRYIFRSNVPVASIDILNAWVDSSEPPKIVGSFFVRENLEEGSGVYEVIPMHLIKCPVVVKRFAERTYYRLGEGEDHMNDPKNEYQYHVRFGTCDPELDPDFIYVPEC